MENTLGLAARRLWRRIESATDVLVGTCLVVSALCAFVGVITRYVFEISTWWVFPIQHYTYIFVIFVGAALAARRRIHVRVEVLEDVLKNNFKTRTTLRLIMHAVALVMACYFTYAAYVFMLWVWAGDQVDTVLTWFPLGVVKSLVFVLGLFFVAYLFRDINASVHGLRTAKHGCSNGAKR